MKRITHLLIRLLILISILFSALFSLKLIEVPRMMLSVPFVVYGSPYALSKQHLLFKHESMFFDFSLQNKGRIKKIFDFNNQLALKTPHFFFQSFYLGVAWKTFFLENSLNYFICQNAELPNVLGINFLEIESFVFTLEDENQISSFKKEIICKR